MMRLPILAVASFLLFGVASSTTTIHDMPKGMDEHDKKHRGLKKYGMLQRKDHLKDFREFRTSTASPTSNPTSNPTFLPTASPTSTPTTAPTTQQPSLSPVALGWNQLGLDLIGEVTSRINYLFALSDDGTSLAVSFRNTGVRVYKFNGISGAWEQVGQTMEGNDEFEELGRVSLDISGDGNIVAAGSAELGSLPYVRVFSYNSDIDAWEQLGQDLQSESLQDFFGEYNPFGAPVSVSDDGTTLAVPGQDSDISEFYVEIFRYTSSIGVWEKIGRVIGLGERYGSSLALSADGNTLAVGDTQGEDDGQGYVIVYQYDSGASSWGKLGQTMLGREEFVEHGFSVDLSADGSILATGAPKPGSLTTEGYVRVHRYNSNSDQWDQIGGDLNGEPTVDSSTFGERFGYSVSLSADGTILAASAIENGENGERAGQVRVFQYDDGTDTWNRLDPDLDGSGPRELFGRTTEISGDGSILAAWSVNNIGDFQSTGRVQVFVRE